MICDPTMNQGDVQLTGKFKQFSLTNCYNFIETKSYNGKINFVKI